MFLSSNYFRIKEIVNEDGQRFVSYSLVTVVLINFVIMLSNSIYILYTLDIVNNSIFKLSLLLAFLYIIVAITDYPTSFITKFTQKQILLIASFLYLLGFFFFSIATDFNTLLLAYFFIGLAQGQESDAFRRYFEDNYYFYVSEDKNRIIYNKITFKMNFLVGASTVISFIIGGLISVFFVSRADVFRTQIILLVIVILVAFYLLHDYPNKVDQKSKKSLFSTLKNNASFCWSNQSLRYFIIGSALSSSTLIIFGTLVIFRIYENFTPDDLVIGVIRSLILIGGGIFSLSTFTIKDLVKNRAWIICISIISSLAIFLSLILFLNLFEPTNEFNLTVVIGLTLLVSIAMFPQTLYKRSKDSYLLRVVPIKKREDVYSFLPLIITLVNIPMILFGGVIMELLSMQDSLLILLLISFFGALISSWGFYIYNYRRIKQELITRTLNVYFGGQFEINAYTTIQLPVKYIWEKFTFSATKLWESVVAEAVRDGSLTNDERALIEKIMLQVRAYGFALEEVIDDAVITLEEEERLDFIRTQLFDVVFAEAKKDGIVTDEEYKILNLFKKHLENFKGFSSHTD